MEVITKIEKYLETRGWKWVSRVRRKGEYTSGASWVAGRGFSLRVKDGKVTIAKNGKHGFIVDLYWSNPEDMLKSAESLAILCYA